MLTNIFTVLGVLAIMLWLSPPLALVVLISVPLTALVTAQVMKRSQRRFVDMWRSTGELNGHVEEAFTGHSLVKVFGRQREVAAVFAAKNDEMYESSFKARPCTSFSCRRRARILYFGSIKICCASFISSTFWFQLH